MIKKAKKCEERLRYLAGMEDFHFLRDAYRRKIKEKIVAFLSSVVYYFGDLLKSAFTDEKFSALA